MKLIFLGLAALSALGLIAGIILLFTGPRQVAYSMALLTPSSIFISAFMIAYVIEERK
jgi:hypothetical protein